MALKIIGSGFGRTGTMSTKMALEQLGLGPCHHMVEAMADPEQPPFWKAHVAGEAVDWHAVFARYNAQIDFPGAAVWPHLVETFPDARVIHTERQEDDWWASYSKTIGKFWQHYGALPVPPEMVRETVPADKLMVFTPSDGWEPLCRFLGVPVPGKNFPRSNARDEFWAHFGGEPEPA
jgi:hypothetical protein